jgi:hypothetical protein
MSPKVRRIRRTARPIQKASFMGDAPFIDNWITGPRQGGVRGRLADVKEL